MTDKELIQTLTNQSDNCGKMIPNKKHAHVFADELFQFLFGCGGGVSVKGDDLYAMLESKHRHLRKQLTLLLSVTASHDETVHKHVSDFFTALPGIYLNVRKDAEAVVNFDPAAESIEEVLAAYPGIYAIAIYRIAHQLHLQGISTLPRILTEYAHGKTGIDIHPAALIGESFFIDHGTGIVIGGTAVIGNNVKIYQGVTLGALQVSKELAQTKRHPTIEDNVIIYSGATILGGSTVIGRNSIIGGNVWLTSSVLADSIVYHKSEVKVRDKNSIPEDIWNFVI